MSTAYHNSPDEVSPLFTSSDVPTAPFSDREPKRRDECEEALEVDGNPSGVQQRERGEGCKRVGHGAADMLLPPAEP